MRKFARNDKGFVSLEIGIGIGVIALIGLGTLANSVFQDKSAKRTVLANQILAWEQAFDAQYEGYSVTDDSATIAGFVNESSLPADTVSDYSSDEFTHALGGTIDPTLNGDNTYDIDVTDLTADDCVWLLGRFAGQVGSDSLTAIEVNTNGVATVTNSTANLACNAAANTVTFVFGI